MSEIPRSFYKTVAWKEARIQCFTRDSWKCVRCGWEGLIYELTCDHIIPRSIEKDKQLELSNLQTLCRTCHNHKTSDDNQKYWGIYNPNVKDFEKYANGYKNEQPKPKEPSYPSEHQIEKLEADIVAIRDKYPWLQGMSVTQRHHVIAKVKRLRKLKEQMSKWLDWQARKTREGLPKEMV